MAKLIPTDEQNTVFEMSKIHRALKISAYAGAAKTSTLVMLAERDHRRSLMMTFSKQLADEAKSRFPSHVECRTVHSMAYAAIGHLYRQKLNRPQGAYKNVAGTGTEIARYFKTGDFMYLPKGEYEARKIKAGGVGVAIKETVARFEQSAEAEMDARHVSCTPCDVNMFKDDKAMKKWRLFILTYAQQLWDLRVNRRSDVLATHDTYLKLWQLSKPDLSDWEVLYLDEFQDTNPVVLDIFIQQKERCQLIAVGDQYQNIYSWRGAINGMAELDWPEAKLTKSFRWGQDVGDIADCILADNGARITAVKGWENLTTYAAGYIPDDLANEPYTMLFRTNGALIVHVVDLLEADPSLKINLEIDVSEFTKKLESAIALYKGEMNKVKHDEFMQYTSWKEFGIEAELLQGEAFRIFKMVVDGTVYKVMDVLSSHRNHKEPQIIMTTAHKSKGREWDIVVLAYDFPSPYNNQGEWVGLNDAERNLLYVAATRAKKFLAMNETVVAMIERTERRDRSSGIQLRTRSTYDNHPSDATDID